MADTVHVQTRRARVLFFAEPATLAHVVRPTALASTLEREAFEVSVATGPDFRHHVEAAGLEVRDLWCIGTRAYLSAVSAGCPVFPYGILRRYVVEDLRVIREFRPDVVVGDFRLSLAVSARLGRIPYIAISNAYWSPYAQARFEIPAHATTRLLGVGLPNAVFRLLRPLIFAQHSLPMHRLCRYYGLQSIGLDLRRVFTEGDLTLFADVPEMVPTLPLGLERRYRYIGPVTWSPSVPIPDPVVDRHDPRPLVYVALGSSGDSSILDIVLAAVISLGCRAVVAGPDRDWSRKYGEQVIARDLLPGSAMASIATLVICNGGSPGVHQALQQGTPVLGIPSNLDQLLNMYFTVQSGAGISVRADQVTAATIRRSAQKILGDDSFRKQAETIRAWFEDYSFEQQFPKVVSDVLGAIAPLNL